jgi:hypothetical protein
MNTRCCGEIALSDSHSRPFGSPATRGAPNPPTFARRCLDIASWFVPSAILTLLPKCPACLAAYVAIGTGVGLSFSAATQVRASLMMLCIALLLHFGVRALGRFVPVKATLLRTKNCFPTIQTKENAL